MAVLCGAMAGCAALTNPVANGIPVRMLRPELLAPRKEPKQTIPLIALRRLPPERYLLGPGDTLSVYVEGVLGNRNEPPPVTASPVPTLPPAVGYPIPVRTDGTVSLPLIKPVPVAGLTVEDAERRITEAYTSGAAPILESGRARILVTLLSPRTVQVLVIRQDSPDALVERRVTGVLRPSVETLRGAEELIGGRRRGTGRVIDLPADQNDVLHALAYTGGLPGLNAANEIIVERGTIPTGEPAPFPPGEAPAALAQAPEVVHIPLRTCPGEPLPFRPDDIVLNNGDVVFIEARDTEVFYTGGLLPSGEYPLPRDYDLDAVEAVTSVGGILVSGGIATSNLDGRVVAPGLGGPSPKLLTVLRRLPNGRQVPIRVDLHRALRDPRENLVIAPGDVLILQETKGQAIGRYFTDVFSFNLFSDVISTSTTTGTAAVVVP
jgi:protein involved in polysaccharide export with SLBB domain